MSGLLPPAAALGWWGRQVLVQEVWIWEDAVRRLGGVSGGVALSGITQNSSSCPDHSAQVQLHKFLLMALVMKCLISNITVLCYLIPHLPTAGVSTSPPCPGCCPASLLHAQLQPLCHATMHAKTQGWNYQSGKPLPDQHIPSLYICFFDI